ncbi:hypothetical protein RvY_16676 [Ramazzottius varieornatus]|uniref:Uncharacterized protein n=1 Tax=Ramazzottius varieornatus TaxID=947166 RepID=A0A1D1W0I2_RAMVA|nr:hypothetical protein RvY_16676 [Ramazzottius varieornatus]
MGESNLADVDRILENERLGEKLFRKKNNMAWYVNEYPKYLERKRNSEEWPGVFQTESGPQFEANITLPAKSIHYDEYMLRRELERAGFVIEKIRYERRPLYLKENQVGGREGVGAIAQKLYPLS